MKKKARELVEGDRVFISPHGHIPTAEARWVSCDRLTRQSSSGGIRVTVYEAGKWIRTIRGSQSVEVED